MNPTLSWRRITQISKEQFNEEFGHMTLYRHWKYCMQSREVKYSQITYFPSDSFKIHVHRLPYRRSEYTSFVLQRVLQGHPSYQEEQDMAEIWHGMLRLKNQKLSEEGT